MIKKVLTMAAALTLVFSMVSCGESDEKTESADVQTTVSSADKNESTAESKAENNSMAENTSSENSEQKYEDESIYNMHFERPVFQNTYSNVYNNGFYSYWSCTHENGEATFDYGFLTISPICYGKGIAKPDADGDPLEWWESVKGVLLDRSNSYGGTADKAKEGTEEWKSAEAVEINGRKFVKAVFSFESLNEKHVENMVYLTCSEITDSMFVTDDSINPNIYGFMFTDISGEDHMEYFDECLKHCAETLHEEKE